MNVTLFVAISVNGYIARPNGDEDFLSEDNWASMTNLAHDYGCLIVGRKTYEVNQSWPEEQSLRGLQGIKKVVVSSNKAYKVATGFEIAESPETALDKLKGFHDVLLIGGGSLNAAFAAKGLLDNVILNIESVAIGRGKQVFARTEFDLDLELLTSSQLSPRILQLQYRVLKNSAYPVASGK